ncbi:glycosyltransferase [Sporolactobacillus terrae]|uniref:Glycosyltransferase n=1 Tax=Sporolactobacillus terrae TaxID=269673 RepID=A0A410D789_9BACL|nr:glycosyltransferase [Sporolactobacillus terrae]QAA21963.1 glycosyltransferase [Sporolactobacillus terrae]QAA24936.1 glycosyltransferase [Sporolactobacillus terrae]BBN98240.1 UDP-D-galactose--(glucosyl)LPS-1,6-D-galactosyltr ansferase [Sporolactobacillus terrae]
MKLYFVLDYLGGRGGVETVVTAISNQFVNKGHEVAILLPKPSGDKSWEREVPNVYYYNEKHDKGNAIDNCIGVAQIIQKIGVPDAIIATHTPHSVLYSRVALGLHSKVPIISWLHQPLKSFYDPHYVKYADLYWAISASIKKELIKSKIDSDKICLVGNPINLNVSMIEPILGNHFVYIGRLENNQKQIDLLLNTLALFQNKWSLDIIGDGPDNEKLKSLAERLNIRDRVRFHGWSYDPWDIVRSIRISALVLVSKYEGFGLVVAEALSRGIPVIATKVEGPDELIQPHENGWLIEPGSSQQLLDAFNEINDLSNDQLKLLSRNARKSVDKYATEKAMDKMIETFINIKERRNRL